MCEVLARYKRWRDYAIVSQNEWLFLQTALPGGNSWAGAFNNVGNNGNWWSATESGANAWNRNLNYTEARVNRNTNNKANGFSCRCVKDWKKTCLRKKGDRFLNLQLNY